MRWDGRIIYSRWLAEDFSRVVLRNRKRLRAVRGRRDVLH